MTEHISTEEAERIAEYEELRRHSRAARVIRSLAAERDAMREAMETATDCCARATACGRILRDALGENQP